jgi:ABC-type branched-subunit amino acid transport system permease subunit
MLGDRSPLLIAAATLVILPFGLEALGLGVTSATEVVVFAMACMALNILVGYTGLVSFGHGTWFGLAAYIAALLQREVTPGSILLPILAMVLFVIIALDCPFVGEMGITPESYQLIYDHHMKH